MKKLLIILFAAGLTFAADAQPRIGGGFKGGGGFGRSRVTVIAPVYPSYGLGYGLGFGYGYRYSPYYDPFYNNYRSRPQRPTKLDLQIEDIKSDYDYQIDTAKHDKSLAKDVRKQKVRDLKHEKDQAIIEAKKQYYTRSVDKDS